MIKNFHFVLQGKGGVGKTTVSTFITQYVKDFLKKDYLAIDTDQVNASFTNFKALNVEHLNITENNQILSDGWDNLIVKLLNTDKTNIIIDNGASSFVPLINYMFENDVVEVLTAEESNYTGYIYLHIVIAGGEGLYHTLGGLDVICKNFNNEKVRVIVWINDLLGKIETQDKSIEDYDEYKKNETKILSVIRLPVYHNDLFKKDLADMLASNRTFNEMLEDTKVFIMTRNRCKRMQKELFKTLDNIIYIFDEEE